MKEKKGQEEDQKTGYASEREHGGGKEIVRKWVNFHGG